MKAKASNSTALDVPVIPPGAPVIFRLAAHCAGPGRGLWMRCHVCRVVLGDEDGRSVPTHTAVREHWAAVHPVELEGLRDRPAAVTAPKVVAKPAHESAVCAADGCTAGFDSGSRGTARYCSARCKNATSNAALAARRRAATAGNTGPRAPARPAPARTPAEPRRPRASEAQVPCTALLQQGARRGELCGRPSPAATGLCVNHDTRRQSQGERSRAWRERNPKVAPPPSPCEHCGRVIVHEVRAAKTLRYCDAACRLAARKTRRGDVDRAAVMPCAGPGCEESIEQGPVGRLRIYCSPGCNRRARLERSS